MYTLQQSNWLGNQMTIGQNDFCLPASFALASTYRLCRIHEYSSTGAYLGPRWYLQAYGHSTRNDLLSLISPVDGGAPGLQCCLSFLAYHDYRVIDPESAIYTR